MDGARLIALAQRGYRIASARIGNPHRLHRPNQSLEPIQDASLVLPELLATFDRAANFPYQAQAKHTEWQRHAIVDGTVLRHGDYLIPHDLAAEAVFVAQPGTVQATLCVACNAVLSLSRPSAPEAVGVIDYRAPAQLEEPLLRGWPASVTASGRGGMAPSDLPGGVPMGDFIVLLPYLPNTALIRNADVLEDQDGRRYAIVWAEAGILGWRLTARSVTTG